MNVELFLKCFTNPTIDELVLIDVLWSEDGILIANYSTYVLWLPHAALHCLDILYR